MRLKLSAAKSITPLRPPSLPLQIAPKLVPGWVAEGLLSTMTLPTGAASKLNRIRSEESITSAAKAAVEIRSNALKPLKRLLIIGFGTATEREGRVFIGTRMTSTGLIFGHL